MLQQTATAHQMLRHLVLRQTAKAGREMLRHQMLQQALSLREKRCGEMRNAVAQTRTSSLGSPPAVVFLKKKCAFSFLHMHSLMLYIIVLYSSIHTKHML